MKTKIPALVTAYLKRAPRFRGFRGFRALKPAEIAREGDQFYYLSHRDTSKRIAYPFELSTVSDSGYIRLGRSILQARAEAIRNKFIWSADTFCGVIYRPLKK